MDWLLFLPLGGTREEVVCSLVMWNIYFFLPVAMVTEPLAGLAPKGARYPTPGPSSRRMRKREGDGSSILILMCHGQCFQLVNFQNIMHKEAIDYLHLTDLTTVLE